MSNLVELMEIKEKAKVIKSAKKVAELSNNLEPEGMNAVYSTIEKNPLAKRLVETLSNLSNFDQENNYEHNTHEIMVSYTSTRKAFVEIVAPEVEKKFASRLSAIKSKTSERIIDVQQVIDYARKNLAAVSDNYLENEIAEILNSANLKNETEALIAQRRIDEIKKFANTHSTSSDPIVISELQTLKTDAVKTLNDLEVGMTNITMAYEKEGFSYNRNDQTTNPRGTWFANSYVELTMPMVGLTTNPKELIDGRTKLK